MTVETGSDRAVALVRLLADDHGRVPVAVLRDRLGRERGRVAADIAIGCAQIRGAIREHDGAFVVMRPVGARA